MSIYPHDKEKLLFPDNTILKQAFKLSFELMQVYEPFGQAASSYEDTGYPEYVALGLRAFLSVPENMRLLMYIGKSTFKDLVMLGQVYTKHGTKEEQVEWKRLMAEMKKADMRTYNAISVGVNEEEHDSKKKTE